MQLLYKKQGACHSCFFLSVPLIPRFRVSGHYRNIYRINNISCTGSRTEEQFILLSDIKNLKRTVMVKNCKSQILYMVLQGGERFVHRCLFYAYRRKIRIVYTICIRQQENSHSYSRGEGEVYPYGGYLKLETCFFICIQRYVAYFNT